MEKRFIKIFLAIVICFISVQLFADDISVTARISNSIIYEGDSAFIEVKVKNANSDNIKVDIPEIDGLKINYRSSQNFSSYSVIVNGKQMSGSSDISYTYTVTPRRKGSFTIPPFNVTVDGTTYTTNNISFNVSEAPKDKNIIFLIELSKESCYITESVDITYKLYYSNNVRSTTNTFISIPLISDNELKNDFNTEVLSEDDRQEVYNGSSYNLKVIKLRISPSDAGEYILPSASFKAPIFTGNYRKRNDFWGRTVNEEITKNVYATTGSKSITVNKVPEENRPSGYSGAVGEYRIEISTKDTLVKMMDPIILQIAIIGNGKLNNLRCPILTEIEALTKDFKVNFNPTATGQVKQDRIVFEQAIHPKSTNITAIPKIPFSFFNTKEGKYITVYSNPIAIKVLPNDKVDSSDVIGNEIASDVDKIELEDAKIALRANYHLKDATDSEKIYLRYLLFLIVFPAFYFIMQTMINRKRRLEGNYALVRAKGAKSKLDKRLSEAIKSIDEDSFFEYLVKGLGKYISDKYNLGEGEFTLVEIENLKDNNQIDDESYNTIKDIIEYSDSARFGAMSISKEEKEKLLDKTKEIIKYLEKKKVSKIMYNKYKYLISILLFILGMNISYAEIDAEIDIDISSNKQAEKIFNNATMLYNKAMLNNNKEERKELFIRSATLYKKLINDYSIINGYIYYNLGNCYYNAGEIGKAILSYRLAEKLIPNDDDFKE